MVKDRMPFSAKIRHKRWMSTVMALIQHSAVDYNSEIRKNGIKVTQIKKGRNKILQFLDDTIFFTENLEGSTKLTYTHSSWN
jgi:hypothetical protein